MSGVRRRALGPQLGLTQVRTLGGADSGAGVAPTLARVAAAGLAAANGAPKISKAPDPITAGSVSGAANGSGCPITLPEGVWILTVKVSWNGVSTEFDYNAGSPSPPKPPHFYGSVGHDGAAIRDQRIISYANNSTFGGDYWLTSAPLAGGGTSSIKARAYPPAGYPTTITFDMTVTATWFRAA